MDGDVDHDRATARRRFNRAMADAVRQLGPLSFGPGDGCRARVVRLHEVAFRAPQASTPHAHTWCELSQVVAGRVAYRHAGRERVVALGGLFAMPAGARHGWRVRSAQAVITGYQLLLTARTPEARAALAAWSASAADGAWTVAADSGLRAVLAELYRAAADGDTARCCALLRAHLRLALERCGVAAGGAAAAVADERMAEVRAHLLEHLAEPLPLAALARRAGCSPRQLARRFAAVHGRPPHRFIIAERLERAGHALRWRDDAVADIAAEVGYPDAGYFARLFRRRFGCSPLAWRRDAAT